MIIRHIVKKVKSSLSMELSELEKVPQVESELLELKSKVSKYEQKLQLLEQSQRQFSGHYEIWREKRVTAIIEHFGPLWFKGKKILELGCGYGDIGAIFSTLGAYVTCSDARQEHLDIVNMKYPHIQTQLADINKEWPFEAQFDLIVHMGVLYHLDDIYFSLQNSIHTCQNLVLETEVSDSSGKDFVLKVQEDSLGYDQSISGIGTRPSIAHLENYFDTFNLKHERINDARCNSFFHQYNWKIEDSNEWRHGLRAIWFITK